MSALIQALQRAEQARRRHRQEHGQRYVEGGKEISTPPATPGTDADSDLPLLDLSSAIRIGQ